MPRNGNRSTAPGQVEPRRHRCSRCAGRFTKDELFRPIQGPSVRLRQHYCRPCFQALAADWRAASERKHLDSYYRRTYGISLADYGVIHGEQAGLCAICRNQERPSKDNDQVRLLAVDHDHETGKVRGLLCSNCNTAIGLLGEDPAILANAIIYLVQHQRDV